MIKTLIAFFHLVLLITSKDFGKHSWPLTRSPKSKTSPLLNTYAVQSGPAPLYQNPITLGYYVAVDFTDDANDGSDASGTSDSDSANMMIALYMSDTVLSSGCLGFFTYDCSAYASCSSNSSEATNLTLPFFEVAGSSISTAIFLDYTYWSLSANATLASTCSSNASSSYGVETAGLLGMGISGDSSNNFMNSPFFGVYLSKTGQSGQIIFGDDPTIAQSDTPVAVLGSDGDWHVSNVTQVQIGDIPCSQNQSSLIFDINSNTIGLPLSIYSSVLNALANYSASCTLDINETPVCSYFGKLEDLPDLQIIVQTQVIPIPASVYVQDGVVDEGSNSITLNLRALDSSLVGNCYITPAYNNYIILDSNVMTYYYTVFQASNPGMITLFVADNTVSDLAIYILIGLAVVLVILFFVYLYLKKQKKSGSHVKLEEENRQSIEQSLISGSLDSSYLSPESRKSSILQEKDFHHELVHHNTEQHTHNSGLGVYVQQPQQKSSLYQPIPIHTNESEQYQL